MLIDVILVTQGMRNLSPVDHLGFKTLHEGSWITSKDTGKFVVQLGAHNLPGNTFFMLHHCQTACNLVWDDSHAKNHVLLLPAPLHILWAFPEGAIDPWLLYCLVLSKIPVDAPPRTPKQPGGGRGEHSEGMDPNGFNLVGTCDTEQVSQCWEVIQQLRAVG